MRTFKYASLVTLLLISVTVLFLLSYFHTFKNKSWEVICEIKAGETETQFKKYVSGDLLDATGMYSAIPNDHSCISFFENGLGKKKSYIWLIGAIPIGVSNNGDLVCKRCHGEITSVIIKVDYSIMKNLQKTPPYTFHSDGIIFSGEKN